MLDVDQRAAGDDFVSSAAVGWPRSLLVPVTTIACISDLHEHLVDVPACDLLLIAGDVSFAFKGDLAAKQAFLAGDFRHWLDRVPAGEVVLVAGNHDQSIEAWGVPGRAAVPLPPGRGPGAVRAADLGHPVAAMVLRLGIQRPTP